MYPPDAELKTKELFEKIWLKLDAQNFKKMELLYNHLAPTGMTKEWFNDKTCLDAGCGSGRFLYTLSDLGVKKAYGIDIGIQSARAALQKYGDYDHIIEVIQGNILGVPFENNSFDFVNCCGVLHTTLAPYLAFKELVRVCKPGGFIVIGVYGKGGFFPFLLKTVRLFVRIIPINVFDKIISNIVPNPIFQGKILDNLYVPIQIRYSYDEIVRWYQNCGLKNIIRVKDNHNRGTGGVLSKKIFGEVWIQMRGKKA